MPHWIVNNSASVMITLIALCIVLMTDLLKKWIWETDVAMWFLILVLDTTIVEVGLDEALSIILSSSLICFLTLGEQGGKQDNLEINL